METTTSFQVGLSEIILAFHGAANELQSSLRGDTVQPMTLESKFTLRLATEADVRALHALIQASVRGLQANDYTPAQVEGALGTVLGIDTQLIADRTYFVAESEERKRLAGCGGWSKRKTLFGTDKGAGREPELLDPVTDAAKVRAIFVHPEFARQGLGSLILTTAENAARAAGFHRFEMGSTLTGVSLYRQKGYVEVETIVVPLWNGHTLPVVKMVKGTK